MREATPDEIVEANIALHRDEAPFYEQLHHEIFNPVEQRRLEARLERAVGYLGATRGWALDFGAGTGNVTTKLARFGFRVVAVDVAREMLRILQNKSVSTNLYLVRGGVPPFRPRTFTMVSAFSVLHHVPDWSSTVSALADLLGPGGILFVDHEADTESPQFHHRPDYRLYRYWSSALNLVRDRLHGNRAPRLDYSLADYHCTPEDHIDWNELERVVREAGMEILESERYLVNYATIPGLLFSLVSRWLADTRYLIAIRRASR